MDEATTVRRATCACGQLAIECTGEPVRVSVCHCLDCQRRSGSAFAVQARFPNDRVTISGQSKQWTRVGDEGGKGIMDFCPDCGSTLFYRVAFDPDMVAVAVGGFGDPNFPTPVYSVYESRKDRWLEITGEGIDHYD